VHCLFRINILLVITAIIILVVLYLRGCLKNSRLTVARENIFLNRVLLQRQQGNKQFLDSELGTPTTITLEYSAL